MQGKHLARWLYFLFTISILLLACTEGKGFKSRGGGKISSHSGSNSYGSNKGKDHSGSRFKSNAKTFAIGAAGGVAAYALMRSMSGSYHSRPGYYNAGYGYGNSCFNNETLNGIVYGQFRCPLNGFPYEAKDCCGAYGREFCCIPETRRKSNFIWLGLVILIIVLLILGFLYSRRRRQRQEEAEMVSSQSPDDEHSFYPTAPPVGYPFPPPSQMGYPPPPQPQPIGYPSPTDGNPYAASPQNQPGNFNVYPQQYQIPYPSQQQSYNPYQVQEGNLPVYQDSTRKN